jgi:hypothetical protein
MFLREKIEWYDKIVAALDTHNASCYTFQSNDSRKCKVIRRELHHSTSKQLIKDDLQENLKETANSIHVANNTETQKIIETANHSVRNTLNHISPHCVLKRKKNRPCHLRELPGKASGKL